MPTIIPPAYGLVAHYHRLVGAVNPSGPMVCTYGVLLPVGDPQETLTLLVAYWGSVVEGTMTGNQELYYTTLKKGPNETGPTYEDNTVVDGTQTGTSVLPQVSLLVRKRTGLGGRANRGRMYLPGIADSNVNVAGTIGSTALGNYQTVMETWLDGLLTEGITPVILHSSSSDPTPISSVVVEPTVATQRRRLR